MACFGREWILVLMSAPRLVLVVMFFVKPREAGGQPLVSFWCGISCSIVFGSWVLGWSVYSVDVSHVHFGVGPGVWWLHCCQISGPSAFLELKLAL